MDFQKGLVLLVLRLAVRLMVRVLSLLVRLSVAPWFVRALVDCPFWCVVFSCVRWVSYILIRVDGDE